MFKRLALRNVVNNKAIAPEILATGFVSSYIPDLDLQRKHADSSEPVVKKDLFHCGLWPYLSKNKFDL